MAKLKVNAKTEFLYLENDFLNKLVEVLHDYNGQKILFVTDSVSQMLIRQNLKLFNCEILFYKKEPYNDTDENNNNDTMSQFVNKNNIRSHLEEVTLIVGIGSDNEINIAKQISAEFGIPYMAVLNYENSSICYSEFYIQNFEIKKGVVPLGIIVNLNDSNNLNWCQKINLENAKIYTLKCCDFFDELFLGRKNFYLNEVDENGMLLNKNYLYKSVKETAEKYCDIVLLEQYENNYHSLFLLKEIYKTISQKASTNHEFILYKTLIKIYEIFTWNFLSKYKCFKCYDVAIENAQESFINSSYIKYILTNFKDLISNKLRDFYNVMENIEEELNSISYINMYKDKLSMSSDDILKAIKVFSKIQKSPTYLNIIDFYNLF